MFAGIVCIREYFTTIDGNLLNVALKVLALGVLDLVNILALQKLKFWYKRTYTGTPVTEQYIICLCFCLWKTSTIRCL